MSTTVRKREKSIPPLQNGDRLTVEEFRRRYEAMPFLKKAELINGIVYLGSAEKLDGELTSSPVSDGSHGGPHFDLVTWLGLYRIATPGVKGGDNSTLRLDTKSMPQPDAYLRIVAECGGQARITDGGFVEHAPELIAEVAASSVNYDLHDKLDVYLQNRVQEYVVWRVLEEAIDWFVRVNDRFELLRLSADGIYQSKVFPGLWLDSAAMIRGDMATVAKVAQAGNATAEHGQFVERLKTKSSGALGQ